MIIMTLEDFIKNHRKTPALIFIDELLLCYQENQIFLPLQETVLRLNLEIIHFKLLDEIPFIHAKPPKRSRLDDNEMALLEVKPFLTSVSIDDQQLLLKAHHWLQWELQSKFCSRCGNGLIDSYKSSEKFCQICNTLFFPRFSPAVMVLIVKGKQILLARSHNFKHGFYSALAGFIELGESAEQAAHREVKEEVGLEITNLKYIGTQAWPFPDSFMIAYRADYLSGEITLEEEEIADAKWFDLDKLPTLPSNVSISRHLIDQVIADLQHK